MSDIPDYPERSHPGDTSPAEIHATRRRILLGVLVAVVLNIGFFAGGAAIATYLATVFRPLFFKTDKIVYVKLDATPAPAPSVSPSPSPMPPTR